MVSSAMEDFSALRKHHGEYRMSNLIYFLKRHSLVAGLTLMFLLTWPLDLANSGVLPVKLPFVVYLFLGWGFIAASVVMTGLTLGKAGVIALLKRYLQWRVGWKWYLAAFILPPALLLLGVILNAILMQVPPDFSTIMAHEIFGKSANLPLFILPFFIVEIISNGEEIGWRGYVLPRLQVKYSAFASSLFLGVIWGLWHLPKYLPHFDPVAFGWFMVHVLAYAVLLTWLYNSTKGSLLLVAISHAAGNTAGIFLPINNDPSSPAMGGYIIYALLEVLAAIVVTVITGPDRLSLQGAKQIQE
jgi:membrane protease YdiL (CAAX protease family)